MVNLLGFGCNSKIFDNIVYIVLREYKTPLQANLNDEIGLNIEGKLDPALSHANWRKDFYAAMGVNEDELSKASSLAGTDAYSEEVEALAQDDVLMIAGAILILEFSIPFEFKSIQKGRDKSFPDKFVDSPDDSAEVRAAKVKARLYIDDHIKHVNSYVRIRKDDMLRVLVI